MKKVLLIGPEPSFGAALARGLEAGGLAVSSVRDGFSGLSIAERERPAAVVVWDDVTDIAPLELGVVLRHDEALASMALVLVVTGRGAAVGPARESVFDQVVAAGAGEPDLRRTVVGLIGRQSTPDSRSLQLAPLRGSLCGSSDVLPLVDLIQTLAGGGHSGVLEIVGEEGFTAEMVLEDGLVRHVQAGQGRGLQAFTGLLRATEMISVGFRFEVRPTAEVARYPPTVMKTANVLLLTSMKELDESIESALAEMV